MFYYFAMSHTPWSANIVMEVYKTNVCHRIILNDPLFIYLKCNKDEHIVVINYSHNGYIRNVYNENTKLELRMNL